MVRSSRVWPITRYYRVNYPALGNLSKDAPGLEVFSGEHVSRVPETPPGPLFAVDGSANLLPGWPRDSAFDILTPAMLADVDGDGLDEIFIHELATVYQGGKTYSHLHGYRADGSVLPGWPVLADRRSLAAAADLDGNGDIEIVTCDGQGKTTLGLTEMTLIAYNHDGTRFEGLNFAFKSAFWCKLHVADVDGDDAPEILQMAFVSESHNRPVLQVISAQGVLEAQWYLDTLQYEPTWTMTPNDVFALADMDGDRAPEIVVQFDHGISVYNADGSMLPGFPATYGTRFEHYTLNNAAPVVGDADGDGYPDILVVAPIGQDYEIDDVRLYNRFGNLHPHFPKKLKLDQGAVPAIADIDLDGRNEIIIRGTANDETHDYMSNSLWVYDLKGANYGAIEWGQFGGSARHQNVYVPQVEFAVVDGYVAPFNGIPLQRGQAEVRVPVRYANLGATPAAAVLTVRLSDGLVYLGDDAAVAPVQEGDMLTWALGTLRYGPDKTLTLRLGIPGGANFAGDYQVEATIRTEGEANPQNDAAALALGVAGLYFPLLQNP